MTEKSQRISVNLYPGSMGLVGLCFELLGADHVTPGDWLGPVGLKNVSPEDVETIIELAKEQGVTLSSREQA